MVLSLKWICQTLAAVNIVQASNASAKTKDQNTLESRFIRSRGLNTTIAGSKDTVTDSKTTSNHSSVSVDPFDHVKLGLPRHSLPSPTIVQECVNTGSTNPVVQDCDCSTERLATQAIEDAITMVQAVKGVWNDDANLNILDRYMGDSCRTQHKYIDGEFMKE